MKFDRSKIKKADTAARAVKKGTKEVPFETVKQDRPVKRSTWSNAN